jgi:pimeloyl-ACP methyl ester carboxylesterase
MPAVELSAGRIDYHDTGGDGPVVVLLRGLLMDSSLWDSVAADLADDHRCVPPIHPGARYSRRSALGETGCLTELGRNDSEPQCRAWLPGRQADQNPS